jgi:excinuclease ABC subunit A
MATPGATRPASAINGSTGVAPIEVRVDAGASLPAVAPARPAVPRSESPGRAIRVRGAREHNLKDINVEIPRDRLVVITGLSGSGKSSLAFDTIFAEGQRKYMESLSAYARQFLDQLKKPDVDEVEGIPPTIAIEQRSTSGNPRSTVATTTEIYDYLRLLFARCGTAYSWRPTKLRKDGSVLARSGAPISATPTSQIVDAVMNGACGPDGSRLMVMAPVVRDQKGFHRDVLESLSSQGWARVRVNGSLIELREALKDSGENPLKLARYEKHTIEAIVDRLVLAPDVRQRLAESVESAVRLGEGVVLVATQREAPSGKEANGAAPPPPEDLAPAKGASKGAPKGSAKSSPKAAAPGTDADAWVVRSFSTRFADPDDPSFALEELSPRLFSFNSPHGACPRCAGLGTLMELDEALVVPNEDLSFRQGAIAAYNKNHAVRAWFTKSLRRFCRATGWSYDAPFKTLPADYRRAVLYGTTKEEALKLGVKLRGAIPELSEWMQSTENPTVKEWLAQFMGDKPCPECHGDRLRIESLHVLLTSTHQADARAAASASVIGRPRHDATMLNVAELSRLNIIDACDYINGLVLTREQRQIAEPILKEINSRLRFLRGVGLEYLSLSRKTATLSGGEAQRIRLATQVGSGLVGACYVLDEPTIGLHQRDNDRLIATLRHLTDIGNTVVVVEHDEDMIRAADWVVDMGPGPGVHGGRVVAEGHVAEIIANPESLTGQYLSGVKRIEVPASRRPMNAKRAIVVKGAAHNNLKGVDVAFPLGGIVCVTGVSGSGKSTLVNDILLAATRRQLGLSNQLPGTHGAFKLHKDVDRIVEVDQSPIGRTPRSNPATYTGIFDDIRAVFATTKEAKLRGYKVGRFSFNVSAKRTGGVGGRCEACEGQGVKKVEMHFLPDVYVECEVCKGGRYNRETLEVKFRGKSIADVLRMTVEEGLGFFENHAKIVRFLQCLHDVGLDYVQLGQPSTQLSGGEAQRVKLASELARGTTIFGAADGVSQPQDTVARRAAASAVPPGQRDDADNDETPTDDAPRTARQTRAAAMSHSAHTLYILDEPTTGLHFEDINKLVGVFDRLADAGNTLVIIEHNLDVIKRADWVIDLGPEGGDNGGRVVASGTPEQVVAVKGSFTGRYLAPMLATR